jgi:signal peptidase I
MRRILRDNASVLAVIAVIALARGSLADHYVVPTGSMEPTLLPGDRVLVDKTAFGWRLPYTHIELGGDAAPRRGDVVIFDSPEDGTRLVKRVAAVPGDRVAVRDGRLLVNDRPLADPERPDVEHWERGDVHLELRHGGGPDLAPTEVPPGRFLVLGDARGNSRDGRIFGFVEQQAIYARALRVFWRSGERFTWRPL